MIIILLTEYKFILTEWKYILISCKKRWCNENIFINYKIILIEWKYIFISYEFLFFYSILATIAVGQMCSVKKVFLEIS